MPYWLFKQEPDVYSIGDLFRDGSAVWDGVGNAVAQKHLRAVRPGDRVLFYHTGAMKAVVGEMEVIGGPDPDPSDPAGKRVTVTVKPVRMFRDTVTLAAIKADPAFADWELVRQPRLSVMPVAAEVWERVVALAEKRTPGA